MFNRKDGLDEMQKERRNNIGNQMFMLLFYALLIDTLLYGQGVRWLEYPSNILAIIMACMGIYLVRLIANNAYLPARKHNKRTLIALILAIAFSVVLAATWAIMFRGSDSQVAESANNYSALILMIGSGVALLIALIVGVIKKVNDKDDKTDSND